MSSFGSFLTSIFGRRLVESAQPLAPQPAPGPQHPENDAQAYHVTVVPAAVASGGWYWQAVRVHHLTPEENNGNHHIYLDALDPTLPQGADARDQRAFGLRVKISWDDGEQIVTLDKPLPESAASFPMWKWQTCAVEALGVPGQELPSDRVVGLQTGHPDEAPGNTLFHHSFSVTFIKTYSEAVICRDSAICGVIEGAGGRVLALRQHDETLARQTLPDDGVFRFAELGAGEYMVAVENTPLSSAPFSLDGHNQVQVSLALVLTESTIAGRVSQGAGRKLSLTRDGVEVATTVVAGDEGYCFAGLGAGTHQLHLEGTRVVSGPIVLTGSNAAAVDLTAPNAGRPLPLYVLFGPAGQPSTKANLLLAQDYLLAFGPSFGFSAKEAASAGVVVIIGDTDDVSADDEAALKAGGALVQRISGTPGLVSGKLAALLSSRRPF